MQSSEQLSELLPALIKARGAIGAVVKNATNPHLKNTYANVAAFIDAIEAPLGENGLALVQCPMDNEAGRPYLSSRIFHSSGQWIGCNVPLIVEKNNMQGMGSAITYARRYALQSMLMLAAEDDDGNGAGGRDNQGGGTHQTGGTQHRRPDQPEKNTQDGIGHENSLLQAIKTQTAVSVVSRPANRQMLADMVSRRSDAAQAFQYLVEKWTSEVCEMPSSDVDVHRSNPGFLWMDGLMTKYPDALRQLQEQTHEALNRAAERMAA